MQDEIKASGPSAVFTKRHDLWKRSVKFNDVSSDLV